MRYAQGLRKAEFDLATDHRGQQNEIRGKRLDEGLTTDSIRIYIRPAGTRHTITVLLVGKSEHTRELTKSSIASLMADTVRINTRADGGVSNRR